MNVQIKRTLGGSVALVVAALALAACGGGDDSGSTGTATSLSAYQKCLSDNGVTLPSGGTGTRPSGGTGTRPSGNPSGMPTDRPTARPSGSAFPGGDGRGQGGFVPSGVDPTKWAQAQEKCSSLRPSGQGGFGGTGQGGPGGGNGANAAYRNCLSEHGVTLQDGQALNTADAKVVAAEKACAVLKPSATPSN